VTRILVTGAAGSIGSALVRALEARGDMVDATDIDTLDVRYAADVDDWFLQSPPQLVFHLAGAKHAPEGELDPHAVAATNIGGTANVLESAAIVGAKVVMASTCKACDPETAYGATKLIAERMVLNAGGSVARFYNVPESAGNVFETWRALPFPEPLPVTPCSRYFMPLERAVELLLFSAEQRSGRYTVDPGPSRSMAEVAADL
jgi:FlaA1/EpsC-like NDP-sugar epimerase